MDMTKRTLQYRCMSYLSCFKKSGVFKATRAQLAYICVGFGGAAAEEGSKQKECARYGGSVERCDGASGSDDGYGGRLHLELEMAWKDSLVVTCLLKIKVVIFDKHRGDKHTLVRAFRPSLRIAHAHFGTKYCCKWKNIFDVRINLL